MVIRKDNEGISKKSIIKSNELIPGDLIELTNNMIVPADVILIYGSCVVKDDFQPDQNTTITKIAIDPKNEGSLDQIDENHILNFGNIVLYTVNHINEGCFGLVCRTGFATKKGITVRN